ncbi:MAG: YHS domain-containing protein [Planctomycetes bacterium]|nr:YHS domain-containing protein [Planctomycetota bacterium]
MISARTLRAILLQALPGGCRAAWRGTCVLLLAACLSAAPAADGVRPYPLDTCLVSNEKIDPAVPAIVYKGQEYRFCCKGCARKFAANPDHYAAKLGLPRQNAGAAAVKPTGAAGSTLGPSGK